MMRPTQLPKFQAIGYVGGAAVAVVCVYVQNGTLPVLPAAFTATLIFQFAMYVVWEHIDRRLERSLKEESDRRVADALAAYEARRHNEGRS